MAEAFSVSRIVVIVDSTETGIRAARFAAQLAALHKAELVAIAVVDTATMKSLLTSNILVESERQEFEQELEASARANLNYVADLARAAHVKAELTLKKGVVHSIVYDEVRRLNPSFLVMGTFTTSLIRRDLSALERRLVVDEVRCPIILVP